MTRHEILLLVVGLIIIVAIAFNCGLYAWLWKMKKKTQNTGDKLNAASNKSRRGNAIHSFIEEYPIFHRGPSIRGLAIYEEIYTAESQKKIPFNEFPIARSIKPEAAAVFIGRAEDQTCSIAILDEDIGDYLLSRFDDIPYNAEELNGCIRICLRYGVLLHCGQKFDCTLIKPLQKPSVAHSSSGQGNHQ